MTIAIDFDGTIVEYDGVWKGVGNFGDIIPGAVDVISKLYDDCHTIIIYTCRSEIELVSEFLKKSGLPFHHINYNPENNTLGLSSNKIKADVYIDDRGMVFRGNWWRIYWQLNKFKEWWR